MSKYVQMVVQIWQNYENFENVPTNSKKSESKEKQKRTFRTPRRSSWSMKTGFEKRDKKCVKSSQCGCGTQSSQAVTRN